MPRFVILTHDHPFPHFDLMLEHASVLRTWRLMETPSVRKAIRAEALGDHRLAYLDYEGPVSHERGSVAKWDVGTFAWSIQENDLVEVELHGAKVSGTFVMRRRIDNFWEAWLAPPSHG